MLTKDASTISHSAKSNGPLLKRMLQHADQLRDELTGDLSGNELDSVIQAAACAGPDVEAVVVVGLGGPCRRGPQHERCAEERG